MSKQARHDIVVISQPPGIREGFPEEVTPENTEQDKMDRTEEKNRLTKTYCLLYPITFSKSLIWINSFNTTIL